MDYDMYDVFLCTMYFCVQCRLIKGSLEVKLPTIWTDEKAEVGRVREEKKKEDQRRERVRGKKMQVHEKVEKAQNTVFFQGVQNKSADPETHDLCLQRSKSSLAKAAGAEPDEPFGQMRDKKLHAVVARSTFRSQKCKKLTVSDHFWRLR